MMPVHIEVIDHKKQRYDTVGDWFMDDKGLQIRVSRMGYARYEFLVAAHELIEAFLCLWDGVDEKHVTQFDLKFEEERREGKHTAEAEPGNDERAPYRRFHQIATLIERFLAMVLGVDWEHYDETVMKLDWRE